MSFDKRCSIIGAALLLATACQVETIDEGPGEDESEFRSLPAVALTQMCPGWRQNAIRNDGCPNIPGPIGKPNWKGSKLFGAGAINEYGTHCLYEYNAPTNPTPPEVSFFQGAGGMIDVATSCLAVMPEGELVTTLNPPLRDLTKNRIDTVSGTEININGTAAGRSPVVVHVLDTTPLVDPVSPPPRNWHGILVADLIMDITHGCQSSSAFCKVVVENHLGLPRYGAGKLQRDLTRGGLAAYHDEVAVGIINALKAWEALPALNKPKLVINLSIGWLREFGGEVVNGAIDDAPPGVKAIQLAIERARCRGAIIIAAAGNEDGECEPNPMLPAEWERLPAPDSDRCGDIDVTLATLGGSDYHPLLYSVGGVDWDDNPIANSRTNGRPRLAALGQHVVGPDLTQAAMTGTSMSAGVISGVAALIWGYKGTLGPDDVMDVIYDSGVEVAPSADYGCEEVKDPIMRVNACEALDLACDTYGGCPNTFNLDCDDDPLSLDELATAVSNLTADPIPPPPIVVTPVNDCPQYCTADTADGYAAAGQGCPTLEGPSRYSHVANPQPDNIGCSSCTWETTSTGTPTQVTTIWATLTRSYLGKNVVNASGTLMVDDGSTMGGVATPFNLGDVDLYTTRKTPLNVPNGPQDPILSGTITLTFDMGGGNFATTTDTLVPGSASF